MAVPLGFDPAEKPETVLLVHPHGPGVAEGQPISGPRYGLHCIPGVPFEWSAEEAPELCNAYPKLRYDDETQDPRPATIKRLKDEADAKEAAERAEAQAKAEQTKADAEAAKVEKAKATAPTTEPTPPAADKPAEDKKEA